MSIGEFFGFGGYTREPEGYMSFEHLSFVSSLVIVMTVLAVWLGLRNRNKDDKLKNRVIVVSAILIDAFEIFKIVIMCARSNNPMGWTGELPLFLCSIQLITIPLAAFSKGRVKESALDFVTIFGIIGALMGTYLAGQNYACYPVLSLDNVVSGITHCISGFTSLYILISRMASMRKKNIPITLAILFVFCAGAYVANIYTDANYMFLSRGDGTPYDIVYNWVSGSAVLYPLFVVLLFVIYITAYYFVFYLLSKRNKKIN